MRPLSERLRDTLTDEEYEELRAHERVFNARTVEVATNGRFPHWNLSRWLQVIQIVSFVAGAIWFTSSEWDQRQVSGDAT